LFLFFRKEELSFPNTDLQRVGAACIVPPANAQGSMMRLVSLPAAILAALCAAPCPAPAQDGPAQAAAKLPCRDGLVVVCTDTAAARVLLRFAAPGEEGVLGRYLYQAYVRGGLGSAGVGLDRSRPAPTQILVFRQVGKRVFASYDNTAFRADGGSAAERQAVRESFANSIVWAGEVDTADGGGGVLVDVSGFLTRDANGIADALKMGGQGAFKLVPGLGFVETGSVHAFPDNVELDAVETFSGDEPGHAVQDLCRSRTRLA
jgi:hypothetical protein